MENNTLNQIGYITAEQYLEFDEAMEKRYEYIDGIVREWNGGPIEPQFVFDNLARLKAERERQKNQCRSFISANLLTATFEALEDSGYEVWHKLPVETGQNRYEPQLTISFGELYDTEDFAFDAANTRVVIEVLSETISSGAFTERLNDFLSMKSLQLYALVSQRKPFVQVYLRRGDYFTYSTYEGIDTVVPLECIEFALPLSTVYRRIAFETEAGNYSGILRE